ncbi:MAG TPA: EamA family transporter [Actinomycetota bacterium]|nr:EamA family transporter [Actinomycetota bacterium]
MKLLSGTTTERAPRLGLVILALGTVYLVWGSTYFGILIAIRTIPPMSMAALRFTVAGGLLYAWAVRRGDREGDRPGLAQWAAAAVVGTALLAAGNGAVTWAEQRIPSGIAALLIASVPLWMSILGRVLLAERLSWLAVVGLAVGFAGLVLLVRPSGTDRLDLTATVVVLGGALAWASGSVWSRRAPLPRRPLVTTGMEMLAGGAVLAVASVVGGEPARIRFAEISVSSVLAVAYLVVFGSLVAFTAYVWLLRNVRTSVVGTYAYVNPVVAVALGAVLGGEPVTGRALLAGAVILAGVALIVTGQPGGDDHEAPRRPDARLAKR